jgi:hypothetical protein
MRIGIGIPIVGSVVGEVIRPLLQEIALSARDFDLEVITTLDVVSYDNARKAIVDKAIHEGCELLFFVDSDTFLPGGGVLGKLVKTLREAGAVLATGHYYRRGYPYTCVWSKIHEGVFWQVSARTGVHVIHTTGLGCALVDLKWVVEHLEKPYFKQGVDEQGHAIQEDCYFCDQILRKGGVIVGNADVRCGHVYTRVVISDKTADWMRKHEMEMMLKEGESADHARTPPGIELECNVPLCVPPRPVGTCAGSDGGKRLGDRDGPVLDTDVARSMLSRQTPCERG